MAVNHTAGTALFPLWPLAGRPAKLVLLRGMKNARARLRVLPGLVLHRPDGQFTADAEAILRNAGPIDLETR
jgi:tRNA1(Val) A37 N6-methylase TrmN6